MLCYALVKSTRFKAMEKKILLIPGDGIGPEITEQAMKVLEAVTWKTEHSFTFEYGFIGKSAKEKFNDPIPAQTIEAALESDAILIGTIGVPEPGSEHLADAPDKYLIELWRKLELHTRSIMIALAPNFGEVSENSESHEREVTIFQSLPDWPLSKQQNTVDIAFDAAKVESGKLIYAFNPVNKAMYSYWDNQVKEGLKIYEFVDPRKFSFVTACGEVLRSPENYHAILADYETGNKVCNKLVEFFENKGNVATFAQGEMFQVFGPLQNSHPKLAGKNLGNPIGSILSAAAVLGALEMDDEMEIVYKAVLWAIENGYVTKDLKPDSTYGTTDVGGLILGRVLQLIYDDPASVTSGETSLK